MLANYNRNTGYGDESSKSDDDNEGYFPFNSDYSIIEECLVDENEETNEDYGLIIQNSFDLYERARWDMEEDYIDNYFLATYIG